MHKTLLCGLILLAAPDGAAPQSELPICWPPPDASVPAATFQCLRANTDGADARFCCGPCSSPSCCPSEEAARLYQEECLLVESGPPTPIRQEEGPGTALATTNTTDAAKNTTAGAADAAWFAAVRDGANDASNSSVEGSVQRQHQLNGLYFCLATLGLVAVFYFIYYVVIGRKFPMSTSSDDGDYNEARRSSLFFIGDLERFGLEHHLEDSPNECIEMEDFAGRPRRDSGLSHRFNPFYAVRPPPPYDDDPPPPYSEHANFPLARSDGMTGVARRNNQRGGRDNMGYCVEGETRPRVGLPPSRPRRGSDPGTTMEQETELTTTPAPESCVGETAPPLPEEDGGGSVGAVVLPEGDGATVASLAT